MIRKTIAIIIIQLIFALNLNAENSKLKIGFIVSLTEALAEFGNAIKNGVTLAKEEHPEINQVYDTFFEDSEYKSSVSINAFKKLSSINKVDAVYVFGGPMSDVLSPIAEKSKLPLFSTEYDPKYSKNKKYVIRFANNASDYGKAMINSLRKKGMKKFAIIKMENQFHNTLSGAFINKVNKDETVKVLYNFLPGERDFKAVFPRLKKEKFDALGIYILPGGHNAFFAQARDAGVNLKQLFGTDGFDSKALNTGIEDVVNGAIFSNSYVSKEFRDKYFKRFKNDDQITQAALAYTFSVLVKDLFLKSKKPKNGIEFIEKFKVKKGINSVCGTYYYKNSKETGQYFSFPIALKSFTKGETKVLELVTFN